jgi:hypothetical protein
MVCEQQELERLLGEAVRCGLIRDYTLRADAVEIYVASSQTHLRPTSAFVFVQTLLTHRDRGPVARRRG